MFLFVPCKVVDAECPDLATRYCTPLDTVLIPLKMKINFLHVLAIAFIVSMPAWTFAQAPALGTCANFLLFSSNGAVSNTGISQLTGNVGTNNGSSTAFGNVNGQMHDGDGVSAQCAADLLIAYNQLNATIPTFFVAPLLGNGDTLVPGVYSITSAATMNGHLYLDAQGDANAVFIFQIQGSFASGANAKVHMLHEGLACNVFWKIEGSVQLATATVMRGTVIANNAAIALNSLDTLEGRLLSTTGQVSVDGILGYTPLGCGSPHLVGPALPPMGTAECYGLFSGNGSVSNSGITIVRGDVGTNVGLTTGFDSLLVNGHLHPIPDASTAQCAADLGIAYQYLNTMATDIELLYPVQFGQNLVLTPHTYLLDAATILTDSLFLNAQGDANATFILKVNGAFSTSAGSKVLLINQAQAQNVYWKIEGAVDIQDNSIFCGTIIANNGALNILNPGVELHGHAFTTSGAMTTSNMQVINAINCGGVGIDNRGSFARENVVSLYPNPFSSAQTLVVKKLSTAGNVTLTVYNAYGTPVLQRMLVQPLTTLSAGLLPSGIYFYGVASDGIRIQSGKLIAQE
jgi:hypothetical protein